MSLLLNLNNALQRFSDASFASSLIFDMPMLCIRLFIFLEQLYHRYKDYGNLSERNRNKLNFIIFIPGIRIAHQSIQFVSSGALYVTAPDSSEFVSFFGCLSTKGWWAGGAHQVYDNSNKLTSLD